MKIRLLCAALLLLAGFPTCSFAGIPGWTIFRKVMPLEPAVIAASAPDFSSADGVLVNPAVAGALPGDEFFVLSERGLAEDFLGTVLFRHRFNRLSVTLGGAYYDAGSAELSWLDNGELKTRNVSVQKDMMGLLSVGYRFAPYLSGGVTVKGAQSEIAETARANAYAGDAGLLIMPTKELSIALAAQNIGGSAAFLETTDRLPQTLSAAGSYVMRLGGLAIVPAAGITTISDSSRSLTEFGVSAGYGAFLFNAGYRLGDDEQPLYLGAGLNAGRIGIGYSFTPTTHLVPVHRFAIMYHFNMTATPELARKKSRTSQIKMNQVKPRKNKSGISPFNDSSPWYKDAIK